MSAQTEASTLTRTVAVGDEEIAVELTSHTDFGTRVTLRGDDRTAVFGVTDDVAEYLQEGTPEPWAHSAIRQLGARLE